MNGYSNDFRGIVSECRGLQIQVLDAHLCKIL
jgi:hypothetical protein